MPCWKNTRSRKERCERDLLDLLEKMQAEGLIRIVAPGQTSKMQALDACKQVAFT